MTIPPSWLDPDGAFGTRSGWQKAGCCKQGEGSCDTDCAFMWYANYTFIPGNASIDDSLRTVMSERMLGTPWTAPGSSPVQSPCGYSGGNPHGCVGGGCASGGYSHGRDGRSLPGNAQQTLWEAGGSAEVAFAIIANHGGGYYYRLCPLPAEGRGALTEDCFQDYPLGFDGDEQWLQYDDDVEGRVAIPAMRTKGGTLPKGSQWTRNPIPGCADSNCSGGPQFEPPVPGAYGWHEGYAGSADLKRLHIVDRVQVPDLPAGDYVLSFRWDCEQTPQVWNTCSDIRITAPRHAQGIPLACGLAVLATAVLFCGMAYAYFSRMRKRKPARLARVRAQSPLQAHTKKQLLETLPEVSESGSSLGSSLPV